MRRRDAADLTDTFDLTDAEISQIKANRKKQEKLERKTERMTSRLSVKDYILNNFKEQCVSLDFISEKLSKTGIHFDRKTVVWAVNELIKSQKAERVARGVYRFAAGDSYSPKLSHGVVQIAETLSAQFGTLSFTLFDSSLLYEFMDRPFFSGALILEVEKQYVPSVVSILRKANYDAFPKSDKAAVRSYAVTNSPILVRRTISYPAAAFCPVTEIQTGRIQPAPLEKMLVDLVCDAEVLGLNEKDEIIGIFRRASEKYNINYSRLLKYATNRGKKSELTELLEYTRGYHRYRIAAGIADVPRLK